MALILYYRWPIPMTIFWLPIFILGSVMAAAGLGFFLSALNVSFRDVKYAVPFLLQMGLFVTPVIYPLDYIPEKWRALLALNPMAGIVVGFRHALLGTPASWSLLGTSLTLSAVLFVAGLLIFRRMERRFADII
jgi:lipopolysaccharide transport system permease protein